MELATDICRFTIIRQCSGSFQIFGEANVRRHHEAERSNILVYGTSEPSVDLVNALALEKNIT